ncbi:MAG: transglycosylase domain-containing protein, partial [Oscillospiraceae bacterium]|nr:transglycosylase domain-containing protein [Oscillospiraceae bacterium]
FLICYAAVYVKTVVMPQTYLDLDEYTMNENSIIYYEDKTSGQWVELQTLKGTENRELIKYTDIPQDLINAFVAIEDKRFWTHPGVDWKRTANGVLRMFTGGNIQGGSTIDQQLIKNITLYDDVTVTRKILEIFKALELEKNYQKEQILTVYFNRIYMGNGCFGVQAAAQYYFGKDVWDLNLAECASLAGITNNPSLYAPYGQVDTFLYQCRVCKKTSSTKDDVCSHCGAERSYDNGSVWTNREFNKARQELILKEMAKEDEAREHPYISEAERDAAIAQPLVFTRDPKPGTEDEVQEEDGKQEEVKKPKYSWYVEAVIDDALDALMEARHINLEAAKQLVFCGGLSIYVPYDPEIQACVDAVYNNRANMDQVSSRTGQRLMSSITVVDNSTGYVVAIGNTMEKTVDRGLNPAVHTKRQPGSSIKPLSVYSPGFEMKLITPATVLDDNPQLLNGNVWPTNAPPVYKGLTTILDAVTRSVNTIALRVVDMVTPKAAYDFMVERYGFTTLEPYRVLSNGDVKSDIDRSPMAMGGLTDGVTTFEMAAAYATFPRDGMFTPATTILEIRDASDKTIIDNRGNAEPVIEARTAYYINAVLSNAVSSGTGTEAKIPGQTVAGKTGTTNNRFNLWFCGYTAHYTAAVWTGYPYDEKINNSGNPSIPMWQKVMARIHEGRDNVAFDVPGELTTYQICMDCGKQAVSECAADSRGSRVQSMRLLKGDGPTD